MAAEEITRKALLQGLSRTTCARSRSGTCSCCAYRAGAPPSSLMLISPLLLPMPLLPLPNE